MCEYNHRKVYWRPQKSLSSLSSYRILPFIIAFRYIPSGSSILVPSNIFMPSVDRNYNDLFVFIEYFLFWMSYSPSSCVLLVCLRGQGQHPSLPLKQWFKRRNLPFRYRQINTMSKTMKKPRTEHMTMINSLIVSPQQLSGSNEVLILVSPLL